MTSITALKSGVLAVSFLALPVLANGCSAANTIAGAAQGCDEFNSPTSVAALKLDASTQAFVQASSDLQSVSTSMEAAVLAACIKIDTDLGVKDTWTTLASNPDAEVQEACTQASTKIKAVLATAASANVTCGLSISGGGCTVSADVQESCEANCNVSASCSPGSISVTARCQPGDLSVECSGTCNASATCEGSVTAPVVNCQGSCTAECGGECDVVPGTAPKVDCQGTCSGNCNGTCVVNGTSTASTAACTGTCQGTCDAKCTYTAGTAPKVHCAGTCTGSCTGGCTVTPGSAGISRGANVKCKGGCTGTATAPSCEGELSALPPSCNANANCQASCQGHAEASAQCTPPTATLDCGASVSSDLQALVTTLQTNLPAILLAAQQQGSLAVKAAGHVVSTAATVASNIGSLTGKALACASTAVSASAKASASVNVSVQVSVSVSGSASGSAS